MFFVHALLKLHNRVQAAAASATVGLSLRHRGAGFVVNRSFRANLEFPHFLKVIVVNLQKPLHTPQFK